MTLNQEEESGVREIVSSKRNKKEKKDKLNVVINF